MKLSIKAFALTAAIIWSAALFIVISFNTVTPGFAGDFLRVVGSIYPGYKPGTGFSSAIIGALYGFVDAGIGGAVFAWLYNLLAGKFNG